MLSSFRLRGLALDLEVRHLPPDNALLERVRAALARTANIEEKKMFGGIAFMVRGKVCVSVGKTRLMCRIDPAIHDKALERPGCRTVTMKGRQYRGYVHVDIAAVQSERDLKVWLGLALHYNKAKFGGN